MLYRFREAQAAELGLSQRTDRRPRIAASCKDLRQCERWRGEILREISRKVSKIQDAGLTDYEVRDLNDEINKLLREKHHWENQIIALGGANYKRASGKITDADGREVPGQRGYKYFGRARDLPGVRELFASAKADQDELQSYKTLKVTRFDNAPLSYYGDGAEQGDEGRALLDGERKAEQKGWEEAYNKLGWIMDNGEMDDLPYLPMPTRSVISLAPPVTGTPSASAVGPAPEEEEEGAAAATTGEKRKAAADPPAGKKTKLADGSSAAPAAAASGAPAGATTTTTTTPTLPGFESIFTAELLQPPRLLTPQEMEKVLVERQKRMLLDEYGVEADAAA